MLKNTKKKSNSRAHASRAKNAMFDTITSYDDQLSNIGTELKYHKGVVSFQKHVKMIMWSIWGHKGYQSVDIRFFDWICIVWNPHDNYVLVATHPH